MWRLPVDPFGICREEDIELAPGDYGEQFDGRIRYLREAEAFALAYQEPGAGRSRGRVHFTIGHELGHYYLHRDYLFSGQSHGSQSDFRSRDTMEQEADEFSASLLMPLELFRSAVGNYRQHVCVLRELCELAETRLGTSVTSTVRRYCQADIEPCAAIFSRNGLVQWACYSEDMRRLGMGFVQFGSPLPTGSRSARHFDHLSVGGQIEGEVEPSAWFERSFHRGNLWEEAMLLGWDGLTLTYLTLVE
jgi:hypothetical protein